MFSRISSIARAVFGDYMTYRRTYNELSRLSNRKLNDIGIQRADIVRVAMGSINR